MNTFHSLRFWRVSLVFVALLGSLSTAQTAEKSDSPEKATVSGKFAGNGKNAAIKFVIVEEHEPFNEKEAITLIFTEKDPAKVKKPSFDAMFGKLGSALILNVFHDGGVFGCQVVHSAHEKQGFSSIGSLNVDNFRIADGKVTAHASTGKEVDTFGEKWEVDLTFFAPVPANMGKSSAQTQKPVASKVDEKKEEETKAVSGPLISARKLALPSDAVDVEFKTTVKQIQFSSSRPVAAVAKEFSTNLKQQGWKDGPGSLIGKQNAILKREQGDANLTIMIQPAGSGSSVKVFAEGLDWSDGGEETNSADKKTGGDDFVKDPEEEAQKLLKEAMKDLPVGL